jgi:hypothetical protein
LFCLEYVEQICTPFRDNWWRSGCFFFPFQILFHFLCQNFKNFVFLVGLCLLCCIFLFLDSSSWVLVSLDQFQIKSKSIQMNIRLFSRISRISWISFSLISFSSVSANINSNVNVGTDVFFRSTRTSYVLASMVQTSVVLHSQIQLFKCAVILTTAAPILLLLVL